MRGWGGGRSIKKEFDNGWWGGWGVCVVGWGGRWMDRCVWVGVCVYDGERESGMIKYKGMRMSEMCVCRL